MYPGARNTHDDKMGTENLWAKEHNTRFMDLMLKYKDQVILEVSAHDHLESIRYLKSKSGEMYRNLIIATGVSPNHGNQMPGFNTFKVEDQIAKDLVETSLDITKTYGLDFIPPLEDIPTYTLDFSTILPDLSVESIDTFYSETGL